MSVLTLFLVSNSALGDATVFTDAMMFETAAGTNGSLAALEGFENNNTSLGGGVFEFPSGQALQAGVPLVDMDGNGFPDGLESTEFIVFAEGTGSQSLGLIEGGGAIPIPTAFVGAFQLPDATVVDVLGGDTNAVGFNVFGGFPFPTDYQIDVFDDLGGLIFSGAVTGPEPSEVGFIGVVADSGQNIGRVEIDAIGNLELIDNVQIWNRAVPEPSTTSLMLLAVVALIGKRRR